MDILLPKGICFGSSKWKLRSNVLGVLGHHAQLTCRGRWVNQRFFLLRVTAPHHIKLFPQNEVSIP